MADASSFLTPWSSFYVMAGSSAAALTGLMFVVITIVMGTERRRRAPAGISTFSTPTVVHFSAALLVSALLSAPWRSLGHAGLLIGIASLFGIAYMVRIIARTAQLTEYVPDIEDWLCYNILPFVAYGAIFAGALGLFGAPLQALFALAGGVLLLIFIGIHNAWDIVTFLAIRSIDEPPK